MLEWQDALVSQTIRAASLQDSGRTDLSASVEKWLYDITSLSFSLSSISSQLVLWSHETLRHDSASAGFRSAALALSFQPYLLLACPLHWGPTPFTLE